MNSSDVYLVQTDTTIGFLSSDDNKLSLLKQRDAKTTKKILQVVDTFKKLKEFVRIPKQYKKKIRNSKISTFIYPNGLGFRVINKDSKHHKFIKKFACLYSTSANITQNSFDKNFAVDKSDVVVYNNNNFCEKISSKIYVVNKLNIKRIRWNHY